MRVQQARKTLVAGLLCQAISLSWAMEGGARATEAPSTSAETATEDTSGRVLSLPDPELCEKRPTTFEFDGHRYYYNGTAKVDWLKARNLCRKYCMDLVSLEDPEEVKLINNFIKEEDLAYIWTSGRLCNFKGCDSRDDLKPFVVNGWFWSGSGYKMAPTNATPPGWIDQPWSHTGHFEKPQPDNAEFEINESVEACMGILNNIYRDGIKWHDIACYHTKPFICEDSDELLTYVDDLKKAGQVKKQTNNNNNAAANDPALAGARRF